MNSEKTYHCSGLDSDWSTVRRRPDTGADLLRAAASVLAALSILIAMGPNALVRAQDRNRSGTKTVVESPDHPVQGVYWERPNSRKEARLDLVEMKAAGIRAVRVVAPLPGEILGLADSLAMTFYRELPLFDYSAGRLTDSLTFALKLLRSEVRSGRNHPSAGPVGLAIRPDSQSSVTCDFLSRLLSRVSSSHDQRFYYVTSFIEEDRCSDRVDFVLIDALEKADPVGLLTRWRTAHDTPVGLASIGWHVDPGAGSGVDREHSAAWQARMLEGAFRSLMVDRVPETFFVHRWRDRNTIPEPGTGGVKDVYDRRYGLVTTGGAMRPAMNVVQGFYSGARTVFSFPRADEPRADFPWFLLLGWVLLITVVVLYASGPRFRYMLPRYFFAHGFFRNAVREAREVLPIVSTALLSVVGLATGMLGTLILVSVSDTLPGIVVARALPETAHQALTAMLARPIFATIFIGSVSLLGMAVWMGVWMIVAARRTPLLPSQALMLAVWPRWQFVALIPAAMAISTLPDLWRLGWSLVLIPVWGASSLWSTVRTGYDLMKITDCSPLAALVIWIINPVVVILTLLFVWAFSNADTVSYLYHLATAT